MKKRKRQNSNHRIKGLRPLEEIKPMLFNSKVSFGKTLSLYSQNDIKNESMLFNCTLDFAMEKGGPITKEFVSLLSEDFKSGIIDTRVHMLMPGWYPCIPGWHHDDVPRSTTSGQPNYNNPEYYADHCMALINGEISPTEFLLGSIEVPTPMPGEVIYRTWDNYLDNEGKEQGARISAPDRTLIYFDCDTFHRGTETIKSGWRWFGRVSKNTERVPTNEIRSQVQVYMSTINAGW